MAICMCDFYFNLSSVAVVTAKMRSINCTVAASPGMLNHRFCLVCRNEFLRLTKYRYLLNEWMGFRDTTNELLEAKNKEEMKGRIVKCVIATTSLAYTR